MWLISDYDGTLKNGKNDQVMPQDLAFVKAFVKQNNHFVIASGRPYFQLKAYMTNLGLNPDYYISNAGAYLYDATGKIVYGKHLEQTTLNQILDYFKTVAIESVIFADDDGEYYLFSNNAEIQANPNRIIVNRDYDSLRHDQVACFKLIDHETVLGPIVKYLQQHFANQITLVINTDSSLVEVHPLNSSKGEAVKHLQKMLNLPDDQIIVAGDDDNDVSMLSYYQHSFCIRQPYNQRIQQYGNYLIDSLNEIQSYYEKITKK